MLCEELTRRIPDDIEDLDELAAFIQDLPIGLRAMAATHRLDVSLALDSLWEHFSNFHSLSYAQETLRGLRELGADVFAEAFQPALQIAQDNWSMFANFAEIDSGECEDFDDDLVAKTKAEMLALTDTMWTALDSQPSRSLMDYWPVYARKHPERVCS